MSSGGIEFLWPEPREVVVSGGSWQLPERGRVFCGGGDSGVVAANACYRLRGALGSGWEFCEGGSGRFEIELRVVAEVRGGESYRLEVTAQGVVVEGEDSAGLFYGAVTLAALIRFGGGSLPLCRIEDWPRFRARGVMVDISRDKVPSMETLIWLATALADLKFNQLQLYTEHTFAYRGHERVWAYASPMMHQQVVALERVCRQHCIELVPNQNSFGHLERWLRVPGYQHLAELPQGGAPLPWGGTREWPAALCPTDGRSIEFLDSLYNQLLPNFTSRQFNVGCDETFDLRGAGRSQGEVKRVGEGRVYLNFLLAVHRLVAKYGKRMQFWADIILHHPELIPELPDEVTALVWGYESDHPFDEQLGQLAASGREFYVCPGTSSWNSLAGRTSNMVENQRLAAVAGEKYGAAGYLVTDWGDGGHWQPLLTALPGFCWGAAMAWYGSKADSGGTGVAVDNYLGGSGLGVATMRLGDLYLESGALRGNGTELFQILAGDWEREPAEGVSRVTLGLVLSGLDELASIRGVEEGVAYEEYQQVIRLMRCAAHKGLALLADRGEQKDSLIQQAGEMLEEVKREHARVWLLRNRPGGLSDSQARFLMPD